MFRKLRRKWIQGVATAGASGLRFFKTAADLGLSADCVGAQGARTHYARCTPPPPRPAGMRVAEAAPAKTAAKLVDILIERKLI